ncbi:YdbH domain-containing protein [Marinobacterium marinum]|uniref:YdbH domain-containing protein n=1 Tax=Marinobacterium marinum TaxID=2756129 RepID=A0A7W1WWF3_9GAMM|nr:YdbH domain-containing protein [Marinobacterium marinum]MBA4501276.1 YdbH domain-containing protein [Marinobacterium marinum]
MRKGLIGLLLCVLLLPLLLWFTLPWSAQYLLQHWLQQQGFEQPELVIQRPSWQQLRIRHISVNQYNNGRRLRLEADNISLRFSPFALLKGNLKELRIERARLNIQADTSVRGRIDQIEQQATPLPLSPFNPAQLFHYAPSQRLVIAQLELHYSAPEQPLWQATGNIDLEPDLLQGRLQLSRDTEVLGYLDLNLDPKLNLAVSLSRDNHYLLRSAHQLTFPDNTWQLRSDFLLDTARLPDWLQRIQPDLTLPVQQPSGHYHLGTRLNIPEILPSQTSDLINSLTLKLESRSDLATKTGPGFSASQANVKLTAELNQGQFSLILDQDSRLSAADIQQAGLRLSHFEARLLQPFQLHGHWQRPNEWQHSALSLRLAPQGITLPLPVNLTLPSADISIPDGPLMRAHYPATLNLPDIRMQAAPYPALDLSLRTDLNLDTAKRQTNIKATLDSRQFPLQLTLDGRVKQDLTGQFEFRLPPTAAAPLYRSLRPWLPKALAPLAIEAGTISSRGEVRLNANRWELNATPNIQQINAVWDEHTHIHNFNLAQQVSLNSAGQISSQGKLEVDHTDSGLRIFGPRLDFDLSLPAKKPARLILSSFSLSALDGIIAVPPLSFNPLQPVFDTRIAVSALELERILDLYPQEGLYGSGVLGGALPISVNNNQVSITQGQLVSQGGGVIRYQPTPEIAQMGKQNPGIKLALDALTDLRFDLLELTLDYAPSGDTLMQARLKGRNPNWQQGRPVDLNLNIEENVLDLLRTLRLTDRVTDAIDRRFQR